MLRISARKGLLAGRFRCEGIHVEEGRWDEVDPNDPKVRASLLAYVPSHVRLYPGGETDEALAAAGLELKDGKLIDARVAAEAAKKAETKKEKAPRAEK